MTEDIKEREAAAAAMNLVENIMLERTTSNLKRLWYGLSL